MWFKSLVIFLALSSNAFALDKNTCFDRSVFIGMVANARDKGMKQKEVKSRIESVAKGNNDLPAMNEMITIIYNHPEISGQDLSESYFKNCLLQKEI